MAFGRKRRPQVPYHTSAINLRHAQIRNNDTDLRSVQDEFVRFDGVSRCEGFKSGKLEKLLILGENILFIINQKDI
jgi:hypothetical protein